MNRRGFLLGAGALLAAPAIVRVSSLMAVKPLPMWSPYTPADTVSFDAADVMDMGEIATFTGTIQRSGRVWLVTAGSSILVPA